MAFPSLISSLIRLDFQHPFIFLPLCLVGVAHVVDVLFGESICIWFVDAVVSSDRNTAEEMDVNTCRKNVSSVKVCAVCSSGASFVMS